MHAIHNFRLYLLTLLDRLHTEQLKGFAIFLVVLGHLWVHVSAARVFPILAGDAVAMFLILSGFGVTMSSIRKRTTFVTFLLKRIRRVFLPYWLVTFIVLSLDYVILRRTLPLDSILMTVLGVNFRMELRHLDYARWFVTFVLLWYALFYLVHAAFPKRGFIISLFIVAFAWFFLNYYLIDFGYHYFAFPAGCLLARIQSNTWRHASGPWKKLVVPLLQLAVAAA